MHAVEYASQKPSYNCRYYLNSFKDSVHTYHVCIHLAFKYSKKKFDPKSTGVRLPWTGSGPKA